MNILCIDVGFCASGIAVVKRNMDEHRVIYTGIIKTKKEAKRRGIYVADDQVRRIQDITNALSVLDDTYDFRAVVTELPHGGAQSANSAATMAIAKTLIVVMTSMWNIPLIHIRPNDIKKFIGGRNDTSKAAIQQHIFNLYRQDLCGDKYLSSKSANGFTGNFEHIADAIAAYETAIADRNLNVLLRD